jgi:hypothetical protein
MQRHTIMEEKAGLELVRHDLFNGQQRVFATWTVKRWNMKTEKFGSEAQARARFDELADSASKPLP